MQRRHNLTVSAANMSIRKHTVVSDNDDAELRRRYEKAFAAMPRKQREIFLAHRLDNLSYPRDRGAHRPHRASGRTAYRQGSLQALQTDGRATA